MLVSYLKTTSRDFKRHRLVIVINILGLAVGLAACMLMYSYSRHELGFDDLHGQSDNIYRLNEVQTFTGTAPQHVALSMYPMGPALLQKYPQIENFVRLVSRDDVALRIDGKLHSLSKVYAVDDSFFEIFDFPLEHGNPADVLDSPNNMVVTERTALTLYGEVDVIGRTLVMGGQQPADDSDDPAPQVRISGVLQNITSQSHLQFDALVPISSFGTEFDTRNSRNWGANWLNTYLLIRNSADIAGIEATFPDFIAENMGARGNEFYELYLQPLSSIHLDSSHITHDYQNVSKSSRSYIYIFLLLAAFVLAIAAINFMNLTSARLAVRMKEVGIRKSLGATRAQVMSQFLVESLLFAIVAGIIALGLVHLALPVLNSVIGRNIEFNPFVEGGVAMMFVTTIVVTGIVAGLYPALLAASITPFRALKQKLLSVGGRLSLQNILVVMQFALSVGMIIATILVSQQLSYMQNRDIGMDKERVLLLPLDTNVRNSFTAFKRQLLAVPGVEKVTASSQRLGNNLHQGGFNVQVDEGPVENISPSNIGVEPDFLAFYDIELLAGRDFSREIPTDMNQAYIINQAMLRFLNWDGIEGKSIGRGEQMGKVIGLVKDFNFNSLHHEVQPLIIHPTDINYSEIAVKIDPARLSEVIPAVGQLWRDFGSTIPFRYEFLDQHFDQLYRGDRQAGVIVGGISILTIIISCLGLFGLTSLTMEKRTKEIAVRRVLGSSIMRILILLNKEFSLLILGAIVLASPIVWYFINVWLNGFAYRIAIYPAVFLLGGLVAALIAFLTISSRVLYTANNAPVHALRDE